MRSSFDIQVDSNDRPLVDVRSFGLREKAITFLFGESGIGKTIISKAFYGLLDSSDLNISINGQRFEKYAESSTVKSQQKNGFFVFQEPSSHLHPLLSVGYQIREGSLGQADGERDILKHLWDNADGSDLESLLNVFPKPYRPSGGEKQRILLVMAFKKIQMFLKNASEDNAVFIFDEPSGSLDNGYRNRFLSYLFELFRCKPFTGLIITHDYSMISEVYHRHKDLLPQIDFEELTLENNKQVQRSFEPKTYLDWLSKQSLPVSFTETHLPVLRIESGIRVFKRRLSFHRTPADTAEIPLSLDSGSWIYLKAPSGVGKTTIAKIIMGLLRVDQFQLSIQNTKVDETIPVSYWKKQCWGKITTMVFQHADEALNQQASVADVFHGLPIRGMKDNKILRDHLMSVFDEELDKDFLSRKVGHLSGGQKQRLNLLRGMMLNTKILILDEPLNGLDFESVTKILYRLQAKAKTGTGIIVISHNEEIFDRLIPKENVYYLKATADF